MFFSTKGRWYVFFLSLQQTLIWLIKWIIKDKHNDLLINLICNCSDHYHMECCLRYWLNTGSTLFFKAVLIEHCNCSLIVTQQASFCHWEAFRQGFLTGVQSINDLDSLVEVQNYEKCKATTNNYFQYDQLFGSLNVPGPGWRPQTFCFVRPTVQNTNIFHLLSQETEKTNKYAHLRSWKLQNCCQFSLDGLIY